MSLLDRLASRRPGPEPTPTPARAGEGVFPSKALGRFLASLTSQETPVLLDLGPVVGGNVSFFGEQLGCKIFVEDLFADVNRHGRGGPPDDLAAHFARRLPQSDASVDGILCWDLFDYLDKPAAQELARQLTRILKPSGSLLGLFANVTSTEPTTQFTKFVIVDTETLQYRPYPASRERGPVLLNRDIIRLFPGLRVTESFLLKNKISEVLFRKATDIP